MLVLESEGLGFEPMNITKPAISFWDGIKVYCNYASLSGNSAKLNTALVNLRKICGACLANILTTQIQGVEYGPYGPTQDGVNKITSAMAELHSSGNTANICKKVTPTAIGAQITSFISTMTAKKDEEKIAAKAKIVIVQYNADKTSPPSSKPPSSGTKPPPAEYVPPAKMTMAGMFTARNMGIVMVGGAVLAAAYSIWQKRKKELVPL